ncbi:MAG TPA: heavy-metal-associated domain-containing protein [Bacteroidia bacterium]
MKKISILILFAGIVVACGGNESKKQTEVSSATVSGATKTSTFKVWGNCETCKKNIEGSLKVAGISKVDWDSETKLMVVTYDSTKINLNQIEKNIAAVGYDNDAYKGDDAAYAELAPCCQYDRKK